MTNAPKSYHSINLPPIGESDHDIVKAFVFNRKYDKIKPKVQKIQIRSGKLSDTIHEIGNINWRELILTNIDVQSKFNIFYDTINNISDVCQPIKSMKLKGDQLWMTDEIKTEINIRQKLLK